MLLSRAIVSLAALAVTLVPARGQVSLTALGSAYTQDFNTLASSGTSSTVPTGWAFFETAANANTTYNTGTGSSNAGDTYSLGAAAGNPERAFGMLQSGTLISTIGASFTNNTGATITALAVSYTGEQWRVTLRTPAAPDQIQFQYSLDATSLSTGAWTGVTALDFVSPNTVGPTGLLNGNLGDNRRTISFTITSLNIAPGATFWIRWTDFNAPAADDALAVDDFSLTPQAGATPLTISTNSPLPDGTVNVGYGVTFTATGGTGAYTWSIVSGAAPPEFTLVGATLSGTPVTASDYSFTMQVADGVDLATKPFTLHINPAPTCTNPVAISSIQGAGATAAITGPVTTSGIVTAVRSNGFYVQTSDGQTDGSANTSEGIFVFTSSAPGAQVVIGNELCVSGTVSEFIPPSDPGSRPITEIQSPSAFVLATGQPLPAPVPLAACPLMVGTIDLYECQEGMRVSVATLTVVAPTDGNLTESASTMASDGIFYGVLPGVARPFREAGIDVNEALPPGSPANVPRFDSNPERVRVNTRAYASSTPIDVTTGATVTNLVGALDYFSRTYSVLVEPSATPGVSGLAAFRPVPAPLPSELTVASFNMQRFYDTVNDPNTSDVALTAAAFDNRLNKASLAIRNALNLPDVIGIQEMENLTTLQALATKVNNDAVTAGGANPNYQAFLVEGNDIGGIDVGLLVKASRVNVLDVLQVGKDTTFVNAAGQDATLNDRPPLFLRATVARAGSDSAYAFTVVDNHLRSLLSIEDPATGPTVRLKRRAQAEFLANELQSRQATQNLISVGDYNAFDVSDGYVDSIGTIKGSPTPADQVVLASSDLVNPDLTDLAGTLPPGERYSTTFDGTAETLDHILVNNRVFGRISRYALARNNADFPAVFRNDANRPERLSDHDMPVVYVTLPLEVTSKTSVFRSGTVYNFATRISSGTVRVTNTSGAPIAGPIYVVIRDLPAGLNLANAAGTTPEGLPYVTSAGTLAAGASVTLPVQFGNPSRVPVNYTALVFSQNF